MIRARRADERESGTDCEGCGAMPDPDADVVCRVLSIGPGDPAGEAFESRLCRSCCRQLAEVACRILEEPQHGGPT